MYINFSGTISINGREISNLRFADDIDLIAGTEEELQELTTTLEYINERRTPRRSKIIQVPRVDRLHRGNMPTDKPVTISYSKAQEDMEQQQHKKKRQQRYDSIKAWLCQC